MFGGTYAKLTIPPGSGLAGGGIAAMYALFGAAVAAAIGVVVVVKIDPRRLWPLVAVSCVLVGVGVAAMLITPMRTLPVSTYEPPPVFEPAFVFSLYQALDTPRSSHDPLTLPFARLDVATGARAVRALPRDSTIMCTAELPDWDFARLEQLRAAAATVRDQCSSDQGCTATSCTDCAPYKLMFMQSGDSTVWRDISGQHLAATSAGQALAGLLVRVYEDAQPWSFCGN
jgi:hypothetical protein